MVRSTTASELGEMESDTSYCYMLEQTSVWRVEKPLPQEVCFLPGHQQAACLMTHRPDFREVLGLFQGLLVSSCWAPLKTTFFLIISDQVLMWAPQLHL